MHIVTRFLAIAVMTAPALAQQSVQPPPQPVGDQPSVQNSTASSGPSLEVTLKFIQNKVNEQGKVNYVESSTDTTAGINYMASTYSIESTIVAIDSDGEITFREPYDVPMARCCKRATGAYTWKVNLKDIGNLEILSHTDYQSHAYQKRGKPGFTFQDNPEFFDLLIRLTPGKTAQRHDEWAVGGKHAKPIDENIDEFVLHFHDAETAGRVAKALVHAVELSGGGSKPEPF